jgi:hypothetical protein
MRRRQYRFELISPPCPIRLDATDAYDQRCLPATPTAITIIIRLRSGARMLVHGSRRYDYYCSPDTLGMAISSVAVKT